MKPLVGIIDVDSKIPNLALMKLSAFHKSLGATVEFYNALNSKCYTTVYASPDAVIKGGWGYNSIELDSEVENMCPDYCLYNCNYAIGYTTRGCNRKCRFCIVPKKEGKVKTVANIYDFWTGQERIMLLDNNLTAIPDHMKLICEQLIKENIKTDFNQGLDIRLITPELARLLSRVKL